MSYLSEIDFKQFDQKHRKLNCGYQNFSRNLRMQKQFKKINWHKQTQFQKRMKKQVIKLQTNNQMLPVQTNKKYIENGFTIKKYSLNNLFVDFIGQNNVKPLRKSIFDIIKCNAVFTRILSFLDIQSLGKFFSLCKRSRMLVKWFFQENLFINEIQNTKKITNQVLYQVILGLLGKKQCQQLIPKLVNQTLKFLNEQNHYILLLLFQICLYINNNITITDQKNTIQHLNKFGIEKIFPNIFIKDYHQGQLNSNEIKQMSQKIVLISLNKETSQYRKEYQLIEQQCFRYIRSLLKKYQYFESFEQIKPQIVSSIQPMNLRQLNIFQVINKNILNIILRFLPFTDSFSLRLTNMKMRYLIDQQCFDLIKFYERRRNRLSNKHGIDVKHIKGLELYGNFILHQKATQGKFILNSLFEIPICKEVIKQSISLFCKGFKIDLFQEMNKNQMLEYLPTILHKVEKDKTKKLRRFLSIYSFESVEQQILENKNKERIPSIYIGLLFKYLECLQYLSENEIVISYFKRQYQLFEKYLFIISKQIYLYQRYLRIRNDKLPIYLNKNYPVLNKTKLNGDYQNIFLINNNSRSY